MATQATRDTQAKHWCFILNNYTDDERRYILLLDVEFVVVGKEVGANGTPHLQGYVILKTKLRMAQVKELLGTPRVHVEKAKGSPEQNLDYCCKDDDYDMSGTPPKKKKRTRDELAVEYQKAVQSNGNDGLLKFRDDNPGVFGFSGHSLLRNY